MKSRKPGGLLLACVLAFTAAAAEPTTLTLDQALALAERRSDELQGARYEWDIAVGAARGAGALPNPVLDAGLGTRTTVAGPEVQLGVSQPLRLARIGPTRRGALFDADALEDWSIDTERRVMAEVSAAFLRVRHADARVFIADEAARLADRILEVTTARVRVGDASELELGAAELALARARAVLASERANRARTLGGLRVAIGAEPGEVLEPIGPVLSRERYVAVLDGTGGPRPDVDALKHELLAAEAGRRLARVQALPDLGIWGR